MNQQHIRRLPTRLPARQFAGSRTQPLSQAAGALCTNPAFWAYLGVSSEAEAAAHVRAVCGITSRTELNTNRYAAQLYHDRIRRPFAATRES